MESWPRPQAHRKQETLISTYRAPSPGQVWADPSVSGTEAAARGGRWDDVPGGLSHGPRSQPLHRALRTWPGSFWGRVVG